jgi:glyoxylase-like metal-dependent hydrolase (beta-lactamase superfamily II)
MQQLPANIQVIDTLHVGKTGTIACYADLQGALVLVDPGPQVSFAEVERQLATHGARMTDVAAILLTHIHLDHAGAVGSIVRDYPHIRVYVHERGAPHLVDPSRLLRSATRIYGALMDALWGEFLPVPAANLQVLQGGEVIDVAGRQYQVLYTPGHAVHHVTYVRTSDGVAFIGDTAGIRMQGYTYIRPATPPPDIDLAVWDASVAAINRVQPQALCLTHFGPVFDVADHLQRMQASNWRWAEYVRDWRLQGWSDDAQIAELRRIATAEMGVDATPDGIAAYQKGASIEMSWQGLSRFWQQQESV